MEVNFCGYNESVATFAAESGVTPGVPVKMTSSNTVGVCSNGDNIVGVAVNVRDGYAAVQLSGYAELDTTDTALAVGYQKLSCAGSNKVKASSTGREYLVVSVADGVVGFIL